MSSQQTWKAMASAVQTPSQLRNYLDICKAWLVEASEPSPETKLETIGWSIRPSKTTQTLGLLEEDVALVDLFHCAICDTERRDVHTICSNPFARAQFSLVCSDCITTIRG